MEERELGRIIGENLRHMIAASPYRTQVAFASAFGIDVRTVGRWVRGALFDLRVILEVARFLDVPYTSLFENEK